MEFMAHMFAMVNEEGELGKAVGDCVHYSTSWEKTCLACGTSTCPPGAPANLFSVSLVGGESLQGWFDRSLEPETMNGENAPLCHECGTRQTARNTPQRDCTPPVVVVNVSRWDGSTRKYSNAKVGIPETLRVGTVGGGDGGAERAG